jgi:hypothetical protein
VSEYTPSTIEVLCRYQEWAGGSSSDETRRAEFYRWLAARGVSAWEAVNRIHQPMTTSVLNGRGQWVRDVTVCQACEEPYPCRTALIVQQQSTTPEGKDVNP